jgi:hypothetical protein
MVPHDADDILDEKKRFHVLYVCFSVLIMHVATFIHIPDLNYAIYKGV